MAYNPFPMNYQPAQIYYPQASTIPAQTNAMPTQNTAQQNGIIWVQGEAGAKSYLVAPNTTVQLWDSEEQVIYLKSADASGMPSMKVLEYTIRSDNTPSNEIAVADNKYISKDEFDGLQKKITALENDINKMKTNKRKREVDDDE